MHNTLINNNVTPINHSRTLGKWKFCFFCLCVYKKINTIIKINAIIYIIFFSLETPSPDPLNIAELVKEPVRAIDFCYHDEDNDVTVLDCIAMCVMVVSYSAESCRGYQMLVSTWSHWQ